METGDEAQGPAEGQRKTRRELEGESPAGDAAGSWPDERGSETSSADGHAVAPTDTVEPVRPGLAPAGLPGADLPAPAENSPWQTEQRRLEEDLARERQSVIAGNALERPSDELSHGALTPRWLRGDLPPAVGSPRPGAPPTNDDVAGRGGDEAFTLAQADVDLFTALGIPIPQTLAGRPVALPALEPALSSGATESQPGNSPSTWAPLSTLPRPDLGTVEIQSSADLEMSPTMADAAAAAGSSAKLRGNAATEGAEVAGSPGRTAGSAGGADQASRSGSVDAWGARFTSPSDAANGFLKPDERSLTAAVTILNNRAGQATPPRPLGENSPQRSPRAQAAASPIASAGPEAVARENGSPQRRDLADSPPLSAAVGESSPATASLGADAGDSQVGLSLTKSQDLAAARLRPWGDHSSPVLMASAARVSFPVEPALPTPTREIRSPVGSAVDATSPGGQPDLPPLNPGDVSEARLHREQAAITAAGVSGRSLAHGSRQRRRAGAHHSLGDLPTRRRVERNQAAIEALRDQLQQFASRQTQWATRLDELAARPVQAVVAGD